MNTRVKPTVLPPYPGFKPLLRFDSVAPATNFAAFPTVLGVHANHTPTPLERPQTRPVF